VLGERHGHGRRARQAHGLEAGEGLDVAGDGGLAPVARNCLRRIPNGATMVPW
jgi:hypothetical protein